MFLVAGGVLLGSLLALQTLKRHALAAITRNVLLAMIGLVNVKLSVGLVDLGIIYKPRKRV